MVRFLLLLLHHHHHFRKTSLHSWMPVCEQSKDRVLKCYHGNPDHTLNCSSEAKEYMECVEKARQVGWSVYTHGSGCTYSSYIMVWSVSSASLFSYIRDCYTRRQPVNSVYIVYCILRIYQHKSYLANTKKCGGGKSARNVYRGGLGLSLLYTRGRQVKHGWKVMKCGGALMYHCRTTVTCT